MTRTCRAFMVLLACAGVTAAQPSAEPPSPDEIMTKLAGAFSRVQDLKVTLEAEVDMERLRVPKMTVTMYFKKPDKVRFMSEGFAMMPREGLFVNPEMLRARYEPRWIGEEKLQGRPCYHLQLVAKDPNARQRPLLIWVDAGTWTLARTQSVPYEGRSVMINFRHELVNGEHWLPVETTATFEAQGEDTLSRAMQPDIPVAQQFSEMRRPLRSGTIRVHYKDYVVNSGLSDELFRSEQEE